MKLQSSLLVFSAWLLVACQGEVVPSTAGSSTGAPTPTPTTQDYTLDFSQGNFSVGYRTNYWMGFDFSQPFRSFTEHEGAVIAPNIVGFQPLGSYCKANGSAPEEHFENVMHGDSVWLDHVDVDMSKPEGVMVTMPSDMCFGYLDPDGTWHWKLPPQQPTWDAAQGHFHMIFQVQQGPVAGFAILSNQGPKVKLETITLVTKKTSP